MRSGRLINTIGLFLVLVVWWSIGPVPAAAAETTTTTGGSITLSASSGYVGERVQIYGVDFINNGGVSAVMFGTTNVTIDNELISDGEFSTHFFVPALPKAVYAVKVTSNTGDSASSTFTILPRIDLEAASGRAGDQIVVSGDGFVASSKVSIYFDHSSSALVTGAASSSGSVAGLACEVPETWAGGHIVSVSDAAGNSVSTDYTIKPVIAVDPVNIQPGEETYISGSGFAPSSQISVELDNLLVTSYIHTESNGTLNSTPITIPAVYAGTHVIKVTDSQRNSAGFTVNASSDVSVTPKSGLIGSQITLNGVGFLPNILINLYYNGQSLQNGTPVRSTDEGSFNASFSVPSTPAGTYSIIATDGINSSQCQFISTSFSGLEVNSGVVGSEIPVSGIGFTAGATVSIKFDGTTIAKTGVDAAGSFSTTFNVPVSTGGMHKIILTDGINPVNYTFTVLPSAEISNADGAGTQITGFLGSNINVRGDGFTPGAQVTLRYDSRVIGGPLVNEDGTFSEDFEAPGGKPGKHTVTLIEGATQFSFIFIMESTPPAVPMPISPTADSQIEGLPFFQWTSVSDPSGVSYVLQVASEPSFKTPVIQQANLDSNSYQPTEEETLASNKKTQPYYWRVKAVDGILNESQWSPAYTFSVGHSLPIWIWCIGGGALIILILVGGYLAGKRWPEMVPETIEKVKAIRIPLPRLGKKE